MNFIIPNSLHLLQTIAKEPENENVHIAKWILFEAKPPHRVLEVNKRFLKMFGFESEQDIIGKR